MEVHTGKEPVQEPAKERPRRGRQIQSWRLTPSLMGQDSEGVSPPLCVSLCASASGFPFIPGPASLSLGLSLASALTFSAGVSCYLPRPSPLPHSPSASLPVACMEFPTMSPTLCPDWPQPRTDLLIRLCALCNTLMCCVPVSKGEEYNVSCLLLS